MTLLYEPDHLDHWCFDVLALVTSDRDPHPWNGLSAGSIARCTCGRFYVIDERSGHWRPLPRWSRRVREAMAHHEERRRRGESS